MMVTCPVMTSTCSPRTLTKEGKWILTCETHATHTAKMEPNYSGASLGGNESKIIGTNALGKR